MLGTLLLAVPIFLRLFHQIPYIILGFLIPFFAILLLSKYANYREFDELTYSSTKIKKFAFYRAKNWPKNYEYLKIHEDVLSQEQQIYSDNFVINDTLNKLVSLVLRDFVNNWFLKISNNPSFLFSIRHELVYVINTLKFRLAEVDYSDMIVHRMVPTLTDHIDKYLIAQEKTKNTKVSNKSFNSLTDIDDDSILASNYNNGKLHRGINVKSQNNETELKAYLASMLDNILPYLLEENELKSTLIKILIRDLLTSCLLTPICAMLSDPDFYNQLIVNILSKQMKDRNDVKKLRSVLRRHSMPLMSEVSLHSMSDLMKFQLSLDTTKEEFETLRKMITHIDDKEGLLKYEYYILLQKEKTVRSNPKSLIEESKQLQQYIKRTDILLTILYSKLHKNEREKSEDKMKKNTSIPKSLEHTTDDLEPCRHAELAPDFMAKNYSLYDILSSSTRLKYFSAFMAQRGDRNAMLDFWLSAESLRNPLEFSTSDIRSAPLHISSAGDDEESSDEEGNAIFTDKELTQREEIKTIFEEYFNLPAMKIPPKVYYKVSEFIEGECETTLSYYRARKNILKLQDFEYNRMKKTDFVAFKTSDLWLKLLVEEAVNDQKLNLLDTEKDKIPFASESIPPKNADSLSTNKQANKLELNGDPLAKYSEVEGNGNYVDVNMTGKVSEKVVKAVEDALNEIMQDTSKQDLFDDNKEKRSSRLVSADVAKDLFGADKDGLFTTGSDQSGEIANSENLFNDVSRITPNKSESDNGKVYDDYDDDDSIKTTTSKESEDKVESSKLKVAAPSDLNLSAEIERLDVEIRKLDKQRLIINALLKKAEVINNVPELRILKKSLLSLEKELKLKSMQKEQYVVQEGENSLFERTKVSISNYLSAKDRNGKTYTMYVIKVVKLSQSNPNKITATWMVARRFSQFHELHTYLRGKYSYASELEFPKKKLVMKFIQGSLIEERQKKLQIYLQQLIKNKDICSDKLFRDFLSSETFDIYSNDALHNVDLSSKKKVKDGSGTKLYNIISSQALYPLLSLTNWRGITDQIGDKNFEINDTLDDSDESSVDQEIKLKQISFIKPICDFLVSVFQLDSSTSWLRGKALILLLQQVFGNTLEKIIRSNIDGRIRQEDTISQLLTDLQSNLWPGGEFRKKSNPRSALDKKRSKEQCRILLHAFLNDTTAKVFGKAAAYEAAETLYIIFQNELLNRQLVLLLLDEIFSAIFPGGFRQ